jgi:hypothetical protein
MHGWEVCEVFVDSSEAVSWYLSFILMRDCSADVGDCKGSGGILI